MDLSGEVKWLEYFDPFTGEYIPVEIEDGVMKDTFRAGEGRVYRLRTDEPPVETEAPTEVPTEPATDAPTEAATTPVTEPAVTEESTTADVTDATEQSGCQSFLGGSAVLLMLAGAAVAMLQKRKEE